MVQAYELHYPALFHMNTTRKSGREMLLGGAGVIGASSIAATATATNPRTAPETHQHRGTHP
jgi:hypothetical protein